MLHETDTAALCQTAPIQPTECSSGCSQLSLALVSSRNRHFLSIFNQDPKNRAHRPDSRGVWEGNDGPRIDVPDSTGLIQGSVAEDDPPDPQLSRYFNSL